MQHCEETARLRIQGCLIQTTFTKLHNCSASWTFACTCRCWDSTHLPVHSTSRNAHDLAQLSVHYAQPIMQRMQQEAACAVCTKPLHSAAQLQSFLCCCGGVACKMRLAVPVSRTTYMITPGKNNNSAQAAQAAIIDTSNTHMQLAGLKAPLETHCHTTLPLLALQLSDAAFLCSSQNYCCHLLRYFTSSARYITRDTNTSTCIRETAVCSYLA